MKRQLMQRARRAIGMANINAQELRAFPMPLPPMAEQMILVRRLETVSGLHNRQAPRRELLDHLHRLVSDRAFNRPA